MLMLQSLMGTKKRMESKKKVPFSVIMKGFVSFSVFEAVMVAVGECQFN